MKIFYDCLDLLMESRVKTEKNLFRCNVGVPGFGFLVFVELIEEALSATFSSKTIAESEVCNDFACIRGAFFILWHLQPLKMISSTKLIPIQGNEAPSQRIQFLWND